MENYIEFELSGKCKICTSTTAIGNMAFQVNNEVEDVLARRQAFANEIGIPYEKFTFAYQSNSSIIKEVTDENKGKGIYDFASGIEGDGLYTSEKGLPICIFHADCVPLFFYDEINKICGIIHVGFKGTTIHAAGHMMKSYIDEKQANPKKIKVFVGPCIQKSSFELEAEQSNILFENQFTKFIEDNHFDMKAANIFDLLSLGILEENIEDCNIDTYTDVKMFSGKEKTPSGRMMSCIYLK